ncbi:hypothetical protein [Parasedimentitalea maritima]|uniref:Uncharacterized protein n=1 Tax=Parasedimentitalea maritima TaxID=2578117 RepID=A0A6A4RDV3_9RHOB|nr:hypothetical protein [Zongyanglinia marina]KAE9628978.1 hypothetical protein GP644_14535 [Zongyanglinia marina]
MKRLKPNPNESPLAFIERADTMGATDDILDSILNRNFGMQDDGEIKSLKLKSSVFWEGFYLERAKGIFERGGSKYAALKFIQRKNGQAGQRKLSEKEVKELVDSVGIWSR